MEHYSSTQSSSKNESNNSALPKKKRKPRWNHSQKRKLNQTTTVNHNTNEDRGAEQRPVVVQDVGDYDKKSSVSPVVSSTHHHHVPSQRGDGSIFPAEEPPTTNRRGRYKHLHLPISSATSKAQNNLSSNSKKECLKVLQRQQERLSATEYISICAEYCTKFTKSVGIASLTKDGDDINASRPSSSISASVSMIKIRTCCTLPSSPTIPLNNGIQSSQKQTGQKDEDNNKELSSPIPLPATGPLATLTTIINIQPLLVLDLNGILCVRVRKYQLETKEKFVSQYRQSVGKISHTHIIPRTDLRQFLMYLSENFCLAIWTSATRKNANLLLDKLRIPGKLRNKLLFVWSQEECDTVDLDVDDHDVYDNTDNNNHRQHPSEQLYIKNLSKIWKFFPIWGKHNTLLIDDTPDKSCPYPHNAIHPPSLNGKVVKRSPPATSTGTTKWTPATTTSTPGSDCSDTAASSNDQDDNDNEMDTVKNSHPSLSTTPSLSSSTKSEPDNARIMQGDGENERQQRMFLEQLVEHWKLNPIETLIVSKPGKEDNNGDDGDKEKEGKILNSLFASSAQTSTTKAKTQLQFLKEHSTNLVVGWSRSSKVQQTKLLESHML